MSSLGSEGSTQRIFDEIVKRMSNPDLGDVPSVKTVGS
jgi:hypothetical protein